MGIACLEVTEGRVVLINADRALSCHRWVSLRTDAGAFTFTSATPEISYTVEAESGPPRSVISDLHDLQIGHSPNVVFASWHVIHNNFCVRPTLLM